MWVIVPVVCLFLLSLYLSSCCCCCYCCWNFNCFQCCCRLFNYHRMRTELVWFSQIKIEMANVFQLSIHVNLVETERNNSTSYYFGQSAEPFIISPSFPFFFVAPYIQLKIYTWNATMLILIQQTQLFDAHAHNTK